MPVLADQTLNLSTIPFSISRHRSGIWTIFNQSWLNDGVNMQCLICIAYWTYRCFPPLPEILGVGVILLQQSTTRLLENREVTCSWCTLEPCFGKHNLYFIHYVGQAARSMSQERKPESNTKTKMSKKERRIWRKVIDTLSRWLHDRLFCPCLFLFRMLRSMLHSGLPFTHVTIVIHFDNSANSDRKLSEMTRRSQTRADGLLLMDAFQPLLGIKAPTCQVTPRAMRGLLSFLHSVSSPHS